jgi:hypothetical protein
MRVAPEENRNRGAPRRKREMPGNYERNTKLALERLQFLAGLEAHRFPGRNADFLAGARISADACLTGTDVEYTEAAQLDSFTFAKRTFHGFKDRFHGLFGLGAAYSGLVYHRIYNIQLDHCSLPLFNGKLC